ncbi:hypothetical protein RO3G_08156 [Rhizopus delemar RA 99-880]|uniref:Uncharacterized protein n=1 Tax=Rhizopus delemar (strain RA 99-880 / ATCC MYA-4621 / FGSC 9543 / NRRL 43880) TaxID=246409 RepID=I1C4S1_RHIO9|nr:hypothetical protein RO3G_08156 [Rhizopus delemar RA 99-880]|eukprot:EIE83451.1 hypothetical protein RO3G_08156 [Rhizopus delemar RA 99-880]
MLRCIADKTKFYLIAVDQAGLTINPQDFANFLQEHQQIIRIIIGRASFANEIVDYNYH